MLSERISVLQHKAGEKSQNFATLLWIAFFFCSVIHLPVPNGYDWVITFVIGFVAFLGASFHGSRTVAEAPIDNWWFLFVQIIGLSFLASFVLYAKVTYLFYAASFCLFVPWVYAVFRSGDAFTVLTPLVKGTYIAFCLFLVLSYLIGPAYSSSVQYSSFIGNPNEFGYILTSVMPCIGFYYIKSVEQESLTKYLHLFALCVVIVLGLMTGSRTTELSLLPQILILVLLTIRIKLQKKHERSATNPAWSVMLSWVLVFSAASIVTVGMFTFGKAIPDSLLGSFSSSIAEVQQGDVGSNGLAGIIESNTKRYTKGMDSNSINDFTSGRIGIWVSFIQDIGMFGHESETKALVSGWRVYNSIYSHNVYLQVAYSAGLLAGIAMCLIMLASLRQSFALLANVRRKPIDVRQLCFIAFVTCSICGFFVYSLISDGYAIFKYIPASVFWIASAALCAYASCKSDKRLDSKSESLPIGQV